MIEKPVSKTIQRDCLIILNQKKLHQIYVNQTMIINIVGLFLGKNKNNECIGQHKTNEWIFEKCNSQILITKL